MRVLNSSGGNDFERWNVFFAHSDENGCKSFGILNVLLRGQHVSCWRYDSVVDNLFPLYWWWVFVHLSFPPWSWHLNYLGVCRCVSKTVLELKPFDHVKDAKSKHCWSIFEIICGGSGVHRLFEGHGQKEGHFRVCFGSQEGTLARVFATQNGTWACFNQPWGQFSVFCQPRGHFSTQFGCQEGTLARILAPNRVL